MSNSWSTVGQLSPAFSQEPQVSVLCCGKWEGGVEGGCQALWEACSSKINFLSLCVSPSRSKIFIVSNTDLYLLHSLWGVLWVCVALFRTGADHKVGLSVWDPSGWQGRLPYCQGILRESFAGMAIWYYLSFAIISYSILVFVLSKITGFKQVDSQQKSKSIIMLPLMVKHPIMARHLLHCTTLWLC